MKVGLQQVKTTSTDWLRWPIVPGNNPASLAQKGIVNPKKNR